MKTSDEVEIDALVEKLGSEDLQAAVAKLYIKWCSIEGTSEDATIRFFAAIVDQQSVPAQQRSERVSAICRAASR